MIAEIRLNKRTKTIKIVNRRKNIHLQHIGKPGPVGPGATVDVGTTTTLEPGNPANVVNEGSDKHAIFDFFIPKGDKGDTGVSTFVRVHHATNPNISRPDAQFVEWVGSVAPSNATVEDTWIDVLN
jgi:hypothetical protein